MKKYTIKQIDEIRAKAIFGFGQANDDSSEWENFPNKEDYIHMAEAIRKADEEAGILLIIDDEKRDADKVIYQYCDGHETLAIGKEIHKNDVNFFTIIQRDNKPVYQCKKEEQDEKIN